MELEKEGVSSSRGFLKGLEELLLRSQLLAQDGHSCGFFIFASHTFKSGLN